MLITDAQIHLWSGEGAPPHHTRSPYTIDRALSEMDAAGVDRAVNCPAIWDPHANDYAVTAAVAHPDRFSTLGWVALDGPPDESRIDELMALPGMRGLRFVLFAPHVGEMLASGALDWVWRAADRLELPVGLMVMPEHLPQVGSLAPQYPGMRLMLDHLAISPAQSISDAGRHLDELTALAMHPNIAVKATGVPSSAADPYPFASTHDFLHRVFDAFGSSRFFWGTDITRMPDPWTDYVSMFTEELPWLRGPDLASVMGGGVSEWIRWR